MRLELTATRQEQIELTQSRRGTSRVEIPESQSPICLAVATSFEVRGRYPLLQFASNIGLFLYQLDQLEHLEIFGLAWTMATTTAGTTTSRLTSLQLLFSVKRHGRQ